MTQKNNKKIVEHFDAVSFSSDSEGALAGMSKTSFTKTAFCTGATGGGSKDSLSSNSPRRRKGDVSLVPNQEQMSSEFSKFNPVWIVFPVLNMIIDILIMIWEVFFFVFKIVFFKTSEMLVPKNFDFGFKSGKKYCMNLLTWRMLLTFLCPPAGVFMAYGLRGFVQILICCVLSLFFYVPGLVYGLIVILRSDVAEYIEQVELNVCQDDGSTTIFSSDDDEKPYCSRTVGESCSVDGKPLPGNPMRLDCCAQPKYDKGSQTWVLGSTGKPATSPGGGVISQYAEGELQCKVDFNTNLAPTKGICVYKSSGSAGTV